MFSKKKTECRVCGYRFTPERENIYTAEEPRSVADMLTKAPTRFSAVDCPVCGCQIALAIRAPRIDLPAITEQHDADAEETEGGEDISTHAPLAGRDSKSVQITMHIFAITDKFQMLLHRMPPVRAFCSFLMQENHADFGCEPPK